MRRVRRDVIEQTNGEQVPWSSSSLTEDFWFAARTDTVQERQDRPEPAQATGSRSAQAWGSIKDTQSIAVLETFIQKFPDSVYASFAKARLKEIRRNTEEKPESTTADSSRRGWLGVSIQNVDKELASGVGMDRNDPHGALITNIHSPGPAEEAGLEIGDALIAVDGERADNARDLARKVAAIKPGFPTKLTILRDGKERTITVKLAESPISKLGELSTSSHGGGAAEPAEPPEARLKDFGITLASPKNHDGQQGVLIAKVGSGSIAEDKGLRANDAIEEVGGIPIYTLSDMRRALSNQADVVVLRIRRGEQRRFVAFTLNGNR
jgi:S1-C subfamily serine protease